MKKSGSKRWLQEHFTDKFVKQAQHEGFRARSIFKLKEISEAYKIIKPNFVVVDLGAAPGSWSEFVVKLVGAKGKVFALDILPIKPIPGVNIIQGDFTKLEVRFELEQAVGMNCVDVVLSDMAPNLSGISDVDQMRASELVKSALNLAIKVLKPGGVFLTKVFHGYEFQEIVVALKKNFKDVKIIKPEASRSRSKEVFLLASGFVIK